MLVTVPGNGSLEGKPWGVIPAELISIAGDIMPYLVFYPPLKEILS